MLRLPIRLWLLLCLSVWLAACGSGAPTPTPAAQAGLGRGDRATVTLTATATATATQPPSPTPGITASPTDDATATPGASPTPSNTPTVTRTPTNTPRPTRTPIPTATPTPGRQRIPILSSTQITVSAGAPTPAVPVPTVMPTIPVPPRTSNILLLGNDDFEMGGGVQRTDSIIVVSVNQERKTASMVSLPRDLYVYIPGWTMNKINTSVPHGGVGALKETILYNFGIPIHYYARIDFAGFRSIIDALGGIDIAVTCRLEDWRLKSPELDIFEEDNYERFALEPGIVHMDGDLALWYARSRYTTSDFDRGRRQQQILRAVLDQAVSRDLIWRVPELWGVYQNVVETDLDIGRILQFASIAGDVSNNGVQNIYLAGDNVTPITLDTPDGPVTAQLPNEQKIAESMLRLYRPPALSRGTRQPLTVEIVNGTGDAQRAQLAAYQLAYYGFAPVISTEDPGDVALTSLTFHAANLRGSYDWLITWLLDLKRPGDRGNGAYDGDGEYGIDLDAEADSPYNYRLLLGDDYNSCRPELFAPQPFVSSP